MKRSEKKLAVRLLAVVGFLILPISTAGALVVNVDGNINEWVSNAAAIYTAADPGNLAFTAVSGVSSWIEDGPGPGGYVSPGYGGQNFDLEAMYAYADQTGLYVAIVTGFDQSGVWSWNGSAPLYRPGDVFFDFGGGGWDLAVETSGLSVGPQPQAWGGTVGNGYTQNGTPWYTNPIDFPTSAPSEVIHMLADSVAPSTVATDQGAIAAFAYSDKTTNDNLLVSSGNEPRASSNSADWNPLDHNVIELYLSSTYLASLGFNLNNDVAVQVHWTEQCGNDVGITPTITVPQVPEPVSMLMLGCLGSGMLIARAATKRRKKA